MSTIARRRKVWPRASGGVTPCTTESVDLEDEERNALMLGIEDADQLPLIGSKLSIPSVVPRMLLESWTWYS